MNRVNHQIEYINRPREGLRHTYLRGGYHQDANIWCQLGRKFSMNVVIFYNYPQKYMEPLQYKIMFNLQRKHIV